MVAGDRVTLVRMKKDIGYKSENVESDAPYYLDKGTSNTILAKKDAAGEGIVVHSGEDGRIIVKGAEHCLGNVGRIMIYNMDIFNRDELIRLIEENNFCVGVMGSKPKLLVASEDIPVDEGADVINKSLLNTMCGQDCLILTSSGMVEHARKRILKYCIESNIEIVVELVN